ncbi:MAG TPA: class I SAM-dependent methyltransferase [Pyrinomonadaceae bacterium]|nr:class I SAM-dependent methyltransferase [Pyrinomonadaceae bacterium]
MNNLLREWSESAKSWRDHSATVRTMFAPVTTALIEAARISAGQSVLDVAGGPGEPSLTIAEIVGPPGTVTYTDAVAEMVAAAEEEGKRRGVSNVRFQQCVAESLPFADDSFDVTVSRLGVMLFSDPAVALREMLRVTKPQGALCFVVWGDNQRNPFTSSVTKVVSRYVDTPAEDADAPGAFRFAEPGKLARLLTQAGATDVQERELNFRIAAPIDIEQFWEMRSTMSGTLREKLATLSPEKARQVALEVQEAVREFFPNNQMNFPAHMLIVSGRKIPPT